MVDTKVMVMPATGFKDKSAKELTTIPALIKHSM
jgi:hypothetical protein